MMTATAFGPISLATHRISRRPNVDRDSGILAIRVSVRMLMLYFRSKIFRKV